MYYDRNVGQAFSSTFEEYRYDALGRRVLTRSRKPSGSEGTIERTVWDGDQVLLEARGYAGQYAVPATMEAWAQTSDSTGSTTLGGIVIYVQGSGIDQPVGIYKFIPETATSAYLTPHANWRGEWTYATLSNGSVCVPTTPVCPGMPGFYQTMDGSHDGAVAPNLSVWWGNILTGRTESGLQYLRNRYYDPKTGRFTQQDPIGLAGGLNLYGFANGDPVNFSDPFGLCVPPDSPECRFIQLVAAGVRSRTRQTLKDAAIVAPAAVGLGLGLAGRGGLIALEIGAARSGLLRASGVAERVAAATGGTVEALAKSEGFKVTIESARNILVRIKATGEMRVSIEGLGSLTRQGVIATERALTHLRNLGSEELIRLVESAQSLLRAAR